MKLKNKGKKIFPSPSSSSAFAAVGGDYLSVLKLLPAAILALATDLSLEDREVLAYMITMSLKSTSSSTASAAAVSNKKPAKKSAAASSSNPHKAPIFGCDCFDCYTSYWFRWDSSANRELIHQAIEAFEEHLLSSEQNKSSKKKKIRDKTARKEEKMKNQLQLQLLPVSPPPELPVELAEPVPSPQPIPLPEPEISEKEEKEAEVVEEEEEEKAVVLRSPTTSGGGVGRKGIVRKVLPDVLGLLNSRLWSLWGPNL
ncbi:hypothetical protein LINPERPRIM_LOCUS22735 [Linum perenne]